jgi:hypothetical protein
MVAIRAAKIDEASMVSAIETLSSIADLELSSTLQDPLMGTMVTAEAPVMLKTVRWLHQKNAEHMYSIARQKLHDILVFFKHSFSSKTGRLVSSASMSGARTVMMLVDEAAENLDRYTKLFFGAHKASLRESSEFHSLCDFYDKVMLAHAPKGKEVSTEASPLVDILEKAGALSASWSQLIFAVPLTVELEDLQRDIDYELLFIRQANGSRFFTPKLIRAMKLACDIEQAVDWQGSRHCQLEFDKMKLEHAGCVARSLQASSYPFLDAFFRCAHRMKQNPLMMEVYSPSIALMEATLQSIRRTESEGTKSGTDYLEDFRDLFLRVVHSSEFQRTLAYPSTNPDSWEYVLLALTKAWASHIVSGSMISKEEISIFKALVNEGMEKAVATLGEPNGSVSHALELIFESLRVRVGTTTHATLARMLQELQEKPSSPFEPLLGQTFPTHIFDMSWRGELIPVIRLPSPTYQEKIDGAVISEIFQMALHARGKDERPALLLNFQDRTSWKDGARCQAIEELERHERSNIAVCSLACSGDWFRQEGIYEALSNAEEFKKELLAHIAASYVPPTVRAFLFRDLPLLIDGLHKGLYGGRNVLTQAKRIEMIDLVTVCVLLRAIEEINPSAIFVTCKDGLDASLSVAAELFSFLKLLNARPINEDESDWLGALMCGLPLMERSRLPFADQYSRLISFIRFFEGCAQDNVWKESSLLQTLGAFLPRGSAFSALIPTGGSHMHQPGPTA